MRRVVGSGAKGTLVSEAISGRQNSNHGLTTRLLPGTESSSMTDSKKIAQTKDCPKLFGNFITRSRNQQDPIESIVYNNLPHFVAFYRIKYHENLTVKPKSHEIRSVTGA
jgi:hypothetical protein